MKEAKEAKMQTDMKGDKQREEKEMKVNGKMIGIEEWDEYFRGILVRKRKKSGEKRERKEEKERVEERKVEIKGELKEEEVESALRKLKRGKVAKENGIQNEI